MLVVPAIHRCGDHPGLRQGMSNDCLEIIAGALGIDLQAQQSRQVGVLLHGVDGRAEQPVGAGGSHRQHRLVRLARHGDELPGVGELQTGQRRVGSDRGSQGTAVLPPCQADARTQLRRQQGTQMGEYCTADIQGLLHGQLSQQQGDGRAPGQRDVLGRRYDLLQARVHIHHHPGSGGTIGHGSRVRGLHPQYHHDIAGRHTLDKFQLFILHQPKKQQGHAATVVVRLGIEVATDNGFHAPGRAQQ